MSDEKNKVTDKASEIAKNIWLAGVGAYGRAVDEAQGRLERAMEPPKLVRDLVKAGSQLEEEANEARAAALSSVEERIAQVRENFQMQRPARMEDLDSLHKKVDKLTRKVDALTRLIKEQQPATKTAAEKKKPSRAAARKSTGTAKKAVTRAKAKTQKKKA